jgi:hypothetical protein
MPRRSLSTFAIALAVVSLLCALPAAGDTVYKGLDLLQTQSGAYVSFATNPLPRNFFGCSEVFAGTIPVVGSPIAASPSINPTDTIVDRLDDVTPLPVGSSGTTRVQIAGLCLKNTNWTDPCGNSWKVTVRLDSSGVTQPIGTMTIFHSTATGGTFNSAFNVAGEVLWTSGGITLGPVADSISLSSTGGCWNHTPGAGGIQVSGPVTIDRDCDGALDTTLPYGTSNFFPGWCGGTWTPIPEQGPHPVGGARKCRVQPVGDASQVSPDIAVLPICPKPVPVEPEPIGN